MHSIGSLGMNGRAKLLSCPPATGGAHIGTSKPKALWAGATRLKGFDWDITHPVGDGVAGQLKGSACDIANLVVNGVAGQSIAGEATGVESSLVRSPTNVE